MSNDNIDQWAMILAAAHADAKAARQDRSSATARFEDAMKRVEEARSGLKTNSPVPETLAVELLNSRPLNPRGRRRFRRGERARAALDVRAASHPTPIFIDGFLPMFRKRGLFSTPKIAEDDRRSIASIRALVHKLCEQGLVIRPADGSYVLTATGMKSPEGL